MSQKLTEGIHPHTHTLFSLNAFNENFEIASLFEKVKRSNNKNFVINIPSPQSPERAVPYAAGAYKVFMGEVVA